METHRVTTPFGRRPLTLAHVASLAAVKSRPPEKAVHKWQVFNAICAAKTRIGVAERALAVLNALLTFHPETALSGAGLVVFPSNEQLAKRAHGMAPTTLRRQLASLVDTGLIIRRDSPNGKRYARKNKAGDIELAFGFDLSPLVVRAEQFEAWAEEVRAEEQALKLVRERITLCRRDIAKMIAAGLDENVPTGRAGQGPGDWMQIHALYRGILDRIPRTAPRRALEGFAEELGALADEVLFLLETHIKSTISDGNESPDGRHIQNSKPDPFIDSELLISQKEKAKSGDHHPRPKKSDHVFPLSMVVDACPDLVLYTKGGIANWRDFEAAVSVVRPMLGISSSAWVEACETMGLIPASITVAAILQKGTAIASAGGYLRTLTERAEAGTFSIGPMLMALLAARKTDRMRA